MNPFIIKSFKNKSNIKELGLFSIKNFDTGMVISQFKGKQISLDDLNKEYSKEEQSDVLQIGKELYLDLDKENHFFIRHNCRPNCYIKIAVNNAFLIALYDIKIGDELLIDYSLTSTDTYDSWKIDCNCDMFYCRKVISGFNYLPEEKKQTLIEKKIIPGYILK